MFVNLYALSSARGECWVDPSAIKYIRRTSEGISVGLDGIVELIGIAPHKAPSGMRKIKVAASAARTQPVQPIVSR